MSSLGSTDAEPRGRGLHWSLASRCRLCLALAGLNLREITVSSGMSGPGGSIKMCDACSDQASPMPGFPSIKGSKRRASARAVRGSLRGSRVPMVACGQILCGFGSSLGSQVHLPGSMESRGLQAETKAHCCQRAA